MQRSEPGNSRLSAHAACRHHHTSTSTTPPARHVLRRVLLGGGRWGGAWFVVAVPGRRIDEHACETKETRSGKHTPRTHSLGPEPKKRATPNHRMALGCPWSLLSSVLTCTHPAQRTGWRSRSDLEACTSPTCIGIQSQIHGQGCASVHVILLCTALPAALHAAHLDAKVESAPEARERVSQKSTPSTSPTGSRKIEREASRVLGR